MNNPHRPKFEIFVDGGVRRASDVMKAVALGATAVGIGRPMIYAMSTYGEEGICKLLEILKDEFEMNMRLVGARNIAELVPGMVDTSALHGAGSVPTLYDANCKSLRLYVPRVGLTSAQTRGSFPLEPRQGCSVFLGSRHLQTLSQSMQSYA